MSQSRMSWSAIEYSPALYVNRPYSVSFLMALCTLLADFRLWRRINVPEVI